MQYGQPAKQNEKRIALRGARFVLLKDPGPPPSAGPALRPESDFEAGRRWSWAFLSKAPAAGGKTVYVPPACRSPVADGLFPQLTRCELLKQSNKDIKRNKPLFFVLWWLGSLKPGPLAGKRHQSPAPSSPAPCNAPSCHKAAKGMVLKANSSRSCCAPGTNPRLSSAASMAGMCIPPQGMTTVS